MTSRMNSDLTSQFPLAIATRCKGPSARLVLRGRDGLVLKQWLIKSAKCTLGSDPECAVCCDLPGISAYHVLIVVGARQTFLRALAPKLTRDGVPVNELLLTDEKSAFEIAGHQFELSRQTISGDMPAPEPTKERMRFALKRPLETKVPTRLNDSSPTVIAQGEHSDLLPGDIGADTPRWVARIVRDAILPLETQLREVIQPIEMLKTEVNREKRRRRAEEERQRDLTDQQGPTEVDKAAVEAAVKEQLAAITARQASAMDVITERISDVNYQLSSIERLVASEGETQPAELDNRITEEIEAQSQSIQKLQEGFVAVAGALNELQASQRASFDNESEWKQNVQGKLDALQNAVENMRSRSVEASELSADERDRYAAELENSQTSFAVAQDTNQDFAHVDLATQTLVSEWDPADLTTVVDSDDVSASQAAIPFAALDGCSSDGHKDKSLSSLPTDGEGRTVSPGVSTELRRPESDDVWDQEAESESIALYGPTTRAKDTSAENQWTIDESLDSTASESIQTSQDSVSTVEPLLDSKPSVVDQGPDGDDAWTNDSPFDAPSAATELEFPTIGNLNESIDSTPNEATRSEEVSAGDADASTEEDSVVGESDFDPFATVGNIIPEQMQPDATGSSWDAQDNFDAANDSDVSVNDFASSNVEGGDSWDEAATPGMATLEADSEPEQPEHEAESHSAPMPDDVPQDSAEAVAEELASLPSWWNSSDEDSATDDSNWDSETAPASSFAEQFIDPEFASPLDYAKNSGSSDGSAADSGTESDAVAGDSPWWTESVSPAPDSQPVQPLEEKVSARAADSEPSRAVDSGSFEQKSEQDSLEDLEVETSTAVAAEEQIESAPVSTAKDTSTSALELIDELAVATEAANEDSRVVPEVDDEFPTVQSHTADSPSASDRKVDPISEDLHLPEGSEVEAVATESDDTALSELETDDPFPTIAGQDNPSGVQELLAPVHDALPQEAQAEIERQSTLDVEEEFPTLQGAAESTFPANEPAQPASEASVQLEDQAEAESLFAAEDVQSSSEAASGLPSAADQQSASEPEDSEQEDSEQEDSVEDYMRRLLARMRGEEETAASATDKNAKAEVAAPIALPTNKPAQAMTGQEATTREIQSATAAPESDAGSVDLAGLASTLPVAETQPESGLTPEQIQLLQEKEEEARQQAGKRAEPEMAGKLAAMRELANSTARTAIGKSNRRRVLSSLLLKATISGVGLAVAGALVAINGFTLNIGLIATGAAVLVAAIWGWDALTTLRQFKQAPVESSDDSSVEEEE